MAITDSYGQDFSKASPRRQHPERNRGSKSRCLAYTSDAILRLDMASEEEGLGGDLSFVKKVARPRRHI